MSADSLIDALDLPTASRLDRRVPKKLLLENGAPSAGDKRLIQEGVEELVWRATLKPTTIGVPEYLDEVREYKEIAVLCLTLRADAKVGRLVELVHRAVPYPVLLFTDQPDHGALSGLSAVHKRRSQGAAEKWVLDGNVLAVEFDAENDGKLWPGFRPALALGKQRLTTLHSLYQGWIDTVSALAAARVTGIFAVSDGDERAQARRDALQECTRLDAEIIRLRAVAAKEKQTARRVELNLEIKRVEAARAIVRGNL